MQLLVVGAGTMGRWFARAVSESVDAVTFADSDASAAAEAAEALDGAVLAEADDDFDVVCVAVPMPAVEAAIAEYAGYATDAVVDVSGVMAPVIDTMAEHAADRERVSLHPLFAPENEPGSIAVVPDARGPVTDRLLETLEARGNTVFETTAEEHDEAMETVQASTHAAVLAFALAVDGVRDEFHTPISEPLTELARAITDGEPRVYADIQEAFDGAAGVAEAAERIADADTDQFEDLFALAREKLHRDAEKR